MKRRNTIYDTRTHTLENRDIPLGIFFAAFCLSLSYYSLTSGSFLFTALSSLTVYLAVLLSSNRTRLLVPVALCTLILLNIPGNHQLIRIVLFSSIIGLTPRRRESVVPLILLLALWATYLNLAEVASLLGRSFYSVGAFDVKLALAEIIGFLILLMLLWCRQFPALFGRLPREVDIATVSFVLFLLSTLVGAAVSLAGTLSLMGLDLDSLVLSANKNSAVMAALTATLIAIPYTLSVSLNKLIRDFGKRVEHILSPNSILGPMQLYPKIVEFNDIFSKVRELLDEQDRKHRELELNVKNTLAQKEEKEKEHRQRLSDADNLSTIFSICHTGAMAVSGSGAVLAVTPALVNQFNLNNLEKFIGRYYLELQASEEAPIEERRRTAIFLQFVGRLLNDQKNLARNQALRSFIKIDPTTYSEIIVYVFDERIIPVDWRRISPQLPPSDLTFIIFSNAKEDHRQLILDQLFPRNLEILGGQSLETLNELSNLATEFDTQLSATTKEIEEIGQGHPSEIESQLRKLVRTTVDFNLEFRAIIADQLKKGTIEFDAKTPEEKQLLISHIQTFNLTEEMQSLLHLFEDLYGLDAEIIFSSPELTDDAGVVHRQEVRVKAISFQYNEFKSILIALLAGIAKRINESSLALTIGTEQIGMNTAALFRGSSPGRYARIVISHQGQSITSNLMPDSLLKLAGSDPNREDLAITLGILSLKVQQMKGFLSIQSSPTKGTFLTIYLPEDPMISSTLEQDHFRKIPHNKISVEPAINSLTPIEEAPSITIASEPTTARVLVISDSENIKMEVTETLSLYGNISIESISKENAQRVGENNSAGAGFGSVSEIDNLFSTSPTYSFEDYDLVILPIFGDLADGMKLLKKVSKSARVAVTTTEADYADALSALYSTLSYPFKADEIIGILEEVIK